MTGIVDIKPVYIEMCCSVLQCAAVRCSVLQCVAVCCSVLQRVAVCCSVLQRAAVCSRVWVMAQLPKHSLLHLEGYPIPISNHNPIGLSSTEETYRDLRPQK